MEDLEYNSDIDIYSDPDDLIIPSDPETEHNTYNKQTDYSNPKHTDNQPVDQLNPLSIQPGPYDYDESFEDSAEKFKSEEFDFPLPLSNQKTNSRNTHAQQASIDSISYRMTDSTRPQYKTSKIDSEDLFITHITNKRQTEYETQTLDTAGTTVGILTKPAEDELDRASEYGDVAMNSHNLAADNRSNSSSLYKIQSRSNTSRQHIEIITESQKIQQLSTKSTTGLTKSPSKQIQILQELQNENTDLRRDLKKLSDQLNDIIDSSNLHTEIRKRPPSTTATKNRLKGEQLKTAEKQFETYKLEKDRLQRRIDKIQSVDYISDLKKTIQDKEQQILKLEKLIKLQDLKHRKAGKDLERYYTDDDRPEELKKITDITVEIGRYKEKSTEIEAELDRMQEVYDNQYEMESNLTEKHEKLIEIASHYNTPINPQHKGTKEQDRIKEHLEKLNKQIGIKQRSYDTNLSKLKHKEQELKQQLASNAKIKSCIQEQIIKVNADVQVSLSEVNKAMMECESVGLGRLVTYARGRSQGNDSSFLTQDNSQIRLDHPRKLSIVKLEPASLSEIKSVKDVKPPKVNNPFGMDLRALNSEKEPDIQPMDIPIPPLHMETNLSARVKSAKEATIVKPKFDFKMAMNSPSKTDLQIQEQETAYLDQNSIIIPLDSEPKLKHVKQEGIMLTAIKSEVFQPDLNGQLYTPSVSVIPTHISNFNARSIITKESLADIQEDPKHVIQVLSKETDIPKTNPLDYLYDMKSKEKPQESAIPTIPIVSRRDRSHLFGAEDSKSPPQSQSPVPQASFLEDAKRAHPIPKEEPKLDSHSSRVTRDRSHLFKHESNPTLPQPEDPLKPFDINPIHKIQYQFDISRINPVFENKLPEALSNSSSRKPMLGPNVTSGSDLVMNKPLFDNKIADPFENLSRNSKNTEVLRTNLNANIPNAFNNNCQTSLFDPQPDIKDSSRRDRSHLRNKEESKPFWQQPILETKPSSLLSSNRRKDTIPNSYSLAEKAEKSHFLMDLEESSSPKFDPNEFKSQLLPTKPSEMVPKVQMTDFLPQPLSTNSFIQPKQVSRVPARTYDESLDLEEEIII